VLTYLYIYSKIKNRCWDLIRFKKEKFGLNQKYSAIMKGFARKEQFLMLSDYFENKFFHEFFEIKREHGTTYAENFFRYLNPSFIIDKNVNIPLM